MTDISHSKFGGEAYEDMTSCRKGAFFAVVTGAMVYGAVSSGDPMLWALAATLALFTIMYAFRYATRTICAMLRK